jgi:hypothetical protein
LVRPDPTHNLGRVGQVKLFLEYNGRKLWDIGFWNLLSDLLSPDGYSYVTDGFGYYCLTNNWNAAEATQSVYLDFTQNPDYQIRLSRKVTITCPPCCWEEVEEKDKTIIRLNSAVTSIDREGKLVAISIKDQQRVLRAANVVLAMPRHSLELLQEKPFWNMDRVVSMEGGGKSS